MPRDLNSNSNNSEPAVADMVAARVAISELQGLIMQKDAQQAHSMADEILLTFLNTHSDPMCKRVAAAWRRSAQRCGFGS